MNWNDCLALGATRIAAILGCPVTTAHSWIRRSGPPEWQKALFLPVIAEATRKHNKPVMPIDARRVAKRAKGKL